MSVIPCILLGYLIGTLNPAYLFSRAKGFDIRDRGSGNAGASNAVVMLGKSIGIFCAFFDIMKAFFAYNAARSLFPMMAVSGILSGTACIIGHIFPAWLGFRGGKGLACLAGVIMAYNWQLFLALLAFEIVFALVMNYICVVSISACVIFPVIYSFLERDLIGMIAMFTVTAVMLYKHKDNIVRMMKDEEVHLSYLWNKEAEIERLRDKFPEDAENAV